MRGTLRPGIKLLIASHNEGKVRELGEMFAPFGIATISAASLGLPEPEESGTSFAENAKLKALSAAKGSGMLALADDSGLEVAALKGEPGIHSARWGGAGKDFGQAMARVHRELETTGSEDRRANFICALALAAPNGWSHVVQGRVDGTLVWPPRGAKGFGYDPIFVPDGHSETFGEMDPDRKNDLSHRLRAFELLMLATYADNADA